MKKGDRVVYLGKGAGPDHPGTKFSPMLGMTGTVEEEFPESGVARVDFPALWECYPGGGGHVRPDTGNRWTTHAELLVIESDEDAPGALDTHKTGASS